MMRQPCLALVMCLALLGAPVFAGSFDLLAGKGNPGQYVPDPVDQTNGPDQVEAPPMEPAAPVDLPTTGGSDATDADQEGQTGQYGYPGQGQSGGSCGTCPGQQGGGYGYDDDSGQPTLEARQALISLLSLVRTDIQMCLASIRPHRFFQNSLAIGHLNNAQSALRRTRLHPAYDPLLSEIDERLSRVKFHLVMNDVGGVAMMLSQLGTVVESMIRSQMGQNIATGSSGTTVFSAPGSTGGVMYPSVPSIPTTSGYDFGQGQNLNPQGVPSGLTPVSDTF